MTLEEAIKYAEEVAEENQRVVDTGIVFDDVTVDMLYCDDTEVIEEHLANYQMYADKYRQIAEWLKDYKQLLDQKSCNDAISRQAVIDKMRERDEELSCLTVKDVRELPSVNPQESKWIPVSERLPEDGGNYLVTITFDIGGEELAREVRKDFFCILSKKWLNLSDDDVIAWMPLPKPYEPQESEE